MARGQAGRAGDGEPQTLRALTRIGRSLQCQGKQYPPVAITTFLYPSDQPYPPLACRRRCSSVCPKSPIPPSLTRGAHLALAWAEQRLCLGPPLSFKPMAVRKQWRVVQSSGPPHGMELTSCDSLWYLAHRQRQPPRGDLSQGHRQPPGSRQPPCSRSPRSDYVNNLQRNLPHHHRQTPPNPRSI